MSRIVKSFLENEISLGRLFQRFGYVGSDVEDMVQETFLRAYNAEQKMIVEEPRAFLFRIAKNVAINDRHKRSKSLIEYVGDASDTELFSDSQRGSVQDEFEVRQTLRLLTRILGVLPFKCRRVFVLRKVYGYSHQEIASSLGISKKTVENQLTIGITRIHERLRRAGYDPVKFARSITGDVSREEQQSKKL